MLLDIKKNMLLDMCLVTNNELKLTTKGDCANMQMFISAMVNLCQKHRLEGAMCTIYSQIHQQPSTMQ